MTDNSERKAIIRVEDLTAAYDGQVILEQEFLCRTLAERTQDLLHLLDGMQADADPLDAPEAYALKVLVQATDLAASLADLNVDAARHILACAAQVVLLARQSLLEASELVAKSKECLAWIVDLRNLSGKTATKPVAHSEPQLEHPIAHPETRLPA